MHDETAAQLTYAEAVRRLNGQMDVLAGLRARAGTLFGAASLATSFLSSAAAKGQGVVLGRAGWAAVILFAFAAVVTMAMFVSVRGLSFTIQREENECLLDAPATDMSVADTYRKFTRRLESNFAANSRRMQWYFRGMWALCGLVGGELLLWTWAFVG